MNNDENISFRFLTAEYLPAEMEKISVDSRGIRIMEKKARNLIIKLGHISSTQANILKQNLLVTGGDVAITRDAISHKTMEYAIVIANRRSIEKVIPRLVPEKIMGDIKRILDEALKMDIVDKHYIKK